jgi:hypothetical protein
MVRPAFIHHCSADAGVHASSLFWLFSVQIVFEPITVYSLDGTALIHRRKVLYRTAVCQGLLLPATKNHLLQCSPDRIDSLDIAYDEANTHITHLGCNLAKNKVTLADFEDWLMVVRGELSDVNPE